jgi:hypothetical protein
VVLLVLGRLEPLLEVRVPDVLDLVVRPTGQLGGNGGPPAIQSSSAYSLTCRKALFDLHARRDDMSYAILGSVI